MTQMPRDPGARACVPVPVPPGPPGIDALMPALAAALAGSGPALAPLPGTGPTVDRLRAATRPDAPVPDSIAAVVATSGSTGDPAGVLLPGGALRAAADGFAERFGRHRWVAALPLHHAGGFMVLVRSLVDGTSPVGVASLGGAQPFTVGGFAAATRAARAGPGRGRPLAVSLVPAMLDVLHAAGARGLDLLSEYDVVLVGGAAAPAALVRQLREQGVGLVTSYGMTETCGGIAFDGRPLPGSSVRADDRGRLVACGRQVAAGYRDGRGAGRWTDAEDGGRCFRTDDLGEVDPDGQVHVSGRVDDVVQVGGSSVSLRAVAARLRACAGVADAEAVSVPDDRFGARIVAFVVPGGAGGLAGHRLAEEVERTLGRAARPRAVEVVERIPRLESGKPDRTQLEWRARALPATHGR